MECTRISACSSSLSPLQMLNGLATKWNFSSCSRRQLGSNGGHCCRQRGEQRSCRIMQRSSYQKCIWDRKQLESENIRGRLSANYSEMLVIFSNHLGLYEDEQVLLRALATITATTGHSSPFIVQSYVSVDMDSNYDKIRLASNDASRLTPRTM